MTKIFIQLILFFFTFNLSYSQDTVYNIKLGHKLSEYPPLYILDGLRISQEKFAELKISQNSIKRIKLDEDFSFSDSVKTYKGSITVCTKILIVLNDVIV